MFKHIFTFFLSFAILVLAMNLSASSLERGERRIKISSRLVGASQIEIVLENRTPLLTFAAEEMQRFLSQATGKNIPIVTRPSQGVTSLVLGDCALARAAGLDVSKLASEGFYIKRIGEDIYLLGLDAPTADPKANPWGMWLHRGSLNAVYDFLERFVGIRFYFAGKYGTIVPSVSKLELPDEIDIMDRPDLIGRTSQIPPAEAGGLIKSPLKAVVHF